MPEFTVKEVRLPELHLPEVKREEIVRTLSGVRLPEVDLAKARRATIKIPAVTLSSSDISKLVAGAAAVARFVRPAPRRSGRMPFGLGRPSSTPIARMVRPQPKRSRWPIAIGAIVVGVVGVWALLRRPAVRERVDQVALRARERFDTFRSGFDGQLDDEANEPVAFTAAETAPIVAEGIADATDDVETGPGSPDYPEGLGKATNGADAPPAVRKSSRRAG